MIRFLAKRASELRYNVHSHISSAASTGVRQLTRGLATLSQGATRCLLWSKTRVDDPTTPTGRAGGALLLYTRRWCTVEMSWSVVREILSVLPYRTFSKGVFHAVYLTTLIAFVVFSFSCSVS